MIKNFKKIFSLFTHRERRRLKFLIVAVVFIAMLEVVGVASIMPFIAVLSDPTIIQTNPLLKWLYHFFEFSGTKPFLFFLGTLVLILLIISNTISALTEWFLAKFTWLGGYSISKRLLAGYLNRPYVFFLNRNSSDLGKNILTEVGHYIKGVLSPVINMLSKFFVSIFIFIFLLFMDPFLSVIIAIVLGAAYSVIFFYVRKNITRFGKQRLIDNEMQFKAVTEALSGIKAIKVLGREKAFLDKFSIHSRRCATSQAAYQVITGLPRYALEVIAFGGILLILLYFLAVKQDIEKVIPMVSVYAFAGYRLMPRMQNVFAGILSLRFNMAVLDVLQRDLFDKKTVTTHQNDELIRKKPLALEKKIEIKELSFSYPGCQEPIINKLNLEIQAKTKVGFVGLTGSGKTTIIDLMLGMFTPLSGQIVVDGVVITKDNLRQWQRNIGYVPQHIFLCDDSILNNITLGIPEKDLDMQAVERAAQIANLHEFIQNELPMGYDTLIGERGVRLSGGQQQRIGIARALYHNPDVLILDEATSALDGITEDAVMMAISRLAQKKTIIIIAHRLTTIKECDVIYVLENGKILDKGTYDELMQTCPKFRAMAKQGKINR